MSVEMHTYVPSVDDSLIPRWLSAMKQLGMACEMHPEISLATHSGFLPFKLCIQDSAHEELNGVAFLTGFEYYISDFSLEAELRKVEPYATVELDARLKSCHKLLVFSWGSADLFELRMATVSSAVLADLTGGLSAYPADGIWYDKQGAAATAVAEARAYENSIKPGNLKVHRFEEWL